MALPTVFNGNDMSDDVRGGVAGKLVVDPNWSSRLLDGRALSAVATQARLQIVCSTRPETARLSAPGAHPRGPCRSPRQAYRRQRHPGRCLTMFGRV